MKVFHTFLLLFAYCWSSTDADYSKESWLQSHNYYRSLHGVPAVNWSDAVAADAAAWAAKLSKGLQHSNSYFLKPPAGPAGENLARGYASAEAVCQAWYSEVACCGAFPGCISAKCTTGHFTAMIWKGVTHIGCASGPQNTAICRYWSGPVLSPATANMQGFYEANIPAPLPPKTIK